MTMERKRQLAYVAARDKAVATGTSIVYWVDTEYNLEYVVDSDGIVKSRYINGQKTAC